MASLQRQAKRAEEYHRLKDELRGLDFRVMGARQRAWSADIAAHEAALGLLHDEERALLDAMERRQASTEAARAARQDLEIRLRAVDEDLTQARVRATEMQARAEAASARREDLEWRIATAASEATRLAERLEEAVVRRRGHEQERAECDVAEREAAGRLEAAERELRELVAAGGPIEREVEVAKDALVEALADEVRLRNLGEALERRRDELQGKRLQLEEEQRALGARLDGNAREREAARLECQRLADERPRWARA
jgi:chromosome segregation ATPase